MSGLEATKCHVNSTVEIISLFYDQNLHTLIQFASFVISSQPFAGCVCLSGWLPNSWNFPVNSYIAEMTPLLWAHGVFDNKVLFHQQALGVQRLEKEGIDVIQKNYPCAHESFQLQEIKDMAEFVDHVLFPKVPKQMATAEFVASVKYLFDHNTDQYNL